MYMQLHIIQSNISTKIEPNWLSRSSSSHDQPSKPVFREPQYPWESVHKWQDWCPFVAGSLTWKMSPDQMMSLKKTGFTLCIRAVLPIYWGMLRDVLSYRTIGVVINNPSSTNTHSPCHVLSTQRGRKSLIKNHWLAEHGSRPHIVKNETSMYHCVPLTPAASGVRNNRSIVKFSSASGYTVHVLITVSR